MYVYIAIYIYIYIYIYLGYIRIHVSLRTRGPLVSLSGGQCRRQFRGT